MARRPTLQQLLAELSDRYGREVAETFLAAMADLRTNAQIQQVIAALTEGNIEAALSALNLDPAVYAQMVERLDQGFYDAGRVATSYLPKRDAAGAAMVLRFGRTPEAEAWLRERSSTLITRLVEDQRQAVRTALTESLAAGINPRQSALRIVGPVSRVTGRREGGVLGLSAPQERAVSAARAELAAGDASGYLQRQRRDKRFDRTIARAARDGKPIPKETIETAINAYERRLLKLRGETIARTETLSSINAGSYESIRQAVASGSIPAGAVKRVWRATFGPRTRDTHAGLSGDSVGLNGAFVSSSGARLRFPGDTSLGAPAAEIVNCRCYVENRVDYRFNEG